jgi:hypothetical protein
MMDDGPKMGDGDKEKRQAAFHAIVGRALTDTEFRRQLSDEGSRRTAVTAALQGTAVDYSEIEEQLNAAVKAVGELGAIFDPDLRAAS